MSCSLSRDLARRYRPIWTRRTIPREYKNPAGWPRISVESLSDDERQRFERLKTAVEAYVEPAPVNTLLKALGVSYQQVQRALERCTSRHPDGRLFGYRALIKHTPVRDYTRYKPLGMRSGSGLAGALQLVFKTRPDVKRELDKFLLTGVRRGENFPVKVTDASSHGYFLQLCADHDPERLRYPFNQKQMGKTGIRNYKHAFLDAHYDEIVGRHYGKAAEAKANTGTGYSSRLIANLPYDVVEIDEHRADFLGSLEIDTPSGRRWLTLRRVILITCTDRRTGVVLGYNVIFRREANSQDILTAVQHALDPWQPWTFRRTEDHYDEGAGFPSGRLADLENCGWTSVLLDGALAHLAHPVMHRMRDRLGCDINIGPVRRFDRRPIVELVFKLIESLGFHPIDSSTGTGPHDPNRQEPERKAREMRLSMYAVLELVELCIAHYNHVVTSRVDGISGLDFIENWAKDPEFDTWLPKLPQRPAHHAPLNIAIDWLNVTGNRAKGIRPRVYFAHTYYTSPALAQQWEHIGSEVIAHYDPNDIRTIELYDATGAYLGTATSEAPYWQDVPHSLEQRNYVAALVREGKLNAADVPGFLQRFLQGLGDDVQRDALRELKGISVAATAVAEERRKQQVALRRRSPAVAANEDAVGPPSHPFAPGESHEAGEDASPAMSDWVDTCPDDLDLNLTITAINL